MGLTGPDILNTQFMSGPPKRRRIGDHAPPLADLEDFPLIVDDQDVRLEDVALLGTPYMSKKTSPNFSLPFKNNITTCCGVGAPKLDLCKEGRSVMKVQSNGNRISSEDIPLSIDLVSSSPQATSLKRKDDLNSPDAEVVAANHEPGFETDAYKVPVALPTEINLHGSKRVAQVELVPSAPSNPDKVLLSYPGLSGVVCITDGDLKRLKPGTFLNDNLIEFGLKEWLRDLETSHPELVDQIHVFNSFFYKKLTEEDLQVAYRSVHKWTKKSDIFRKKYIIVPINQDLHWYLAIIYEPEHILKDPLVNQQRPAQTISESDHNSTRIFKRIDSLETEMKVERSIEDIQKSCTIEDHALPVPSAPILGEGRRSLGKEAQSGTKSPGMGNEGEIIDNVPKTYIFTFDSLGSQHHQAVKTLSAYLTMEAEYKKGVKVAGIVEGKTALVPRQTNLCDCGIYLLHFAQTFMSDPRKYATVILSSQSKSIGHIECKAIWLVDENFERAGRRQLRLRIEEALSKDCNKQDGSQRLSEDTERNGGLEDEVEFVE